MLRKKDRCWVSYSHAVTDLLMGTSFKPRFKPYTKHLKGCFLFWGMLAVERKLAKVVPESILTTAVIDLLEDRLHDISFMLVTDFNLL